MANLSTILATAERALGVLRLLEPVLGKDAPIVGDVLGIVGKALTGAKAGAGAYDKFVDELEGVIAEMDAIRARGGAVGTDFRAEHAAIQERGARLDALLKRLKA